jgi:hypothetical protein
MSGVLGFILGVVALWIVAELIKKFQDIRRDSNGSGGGRHRRPVAPANALARAIGESMHAMTDRLVSLTVPGYP